MIVNLISAKWGELPFETKNPKAKDLTFPGAQMITCQNPAKGNCYVIQQFDTPLFVIRYCCFYSCERDILKFYSNEETMCFHMGINYSHRVVSPANGRQTFHERHYNCFYEPRFYLEYPLGKFERFIFLDILMKKDYRLYLHYYFPETEALFEKVSSGIAARLFPKNRIALAETWRWHNELLDWCYDENKNTEDADIIANNLIKNGICSEKCEPGQTGIRLSQPKINKIYLAAEIIENTGNHYSLEELSTKVRLSPEQLDAGFNEIYGHPLQEHRFEEKMTNALRMLDCVDASIPLTAQLLGYKDPNKFTDDFTRRFGYAPVTRAEKVS